MRIESRGIQISEIFDPKTDDGESIEISANGKFVTLYLKDKNNEMRQMDYNADQFRRLLNAMVAADREIGKIENPTAGGLA